MRIFSSLYARVMQWARHKYATAWLALVSFTESSFFLVPPDVMLAPMTLAKPEKAWFYAGLTTVMSVLGGVLGYVIGMYAFHLAEPFLIRMDYMESFALAQQWFNSYGFWVILLAGFTPIPYKVFTIAAGATGMLLIPFILGSLVGRGLRYYLIAGLMRWGGVVLEAKLYLWADRLGWLTVIAAVIAYFIFV